MGALMPGKLPYNTAGSVGVRKYVYRDAWGYLMVKLIRTFPTLQTFGRGSGATLPKTTVMRLLFL